MITKEAIEQLQDSGLKPEVIEIDGVKRLAYPNTMSVQKNMPSQPAPLPVYTLGGVVEYLRNCNADAELWTVPNSGDCDTAAGKYYIHIESFKSVKILSGLEPTHMVRRNYVHAQCRDNEFRFEHFMSIERFVISVMTSFTDTEQRGQLLDFVSQIKADHSREEVDQGVTQAVTVRKSIATIGVARVPNPVELQPYLTFPEITQPLRSYVFRIKQQAPEDPITCALFPIESSIWEAQTCERIREYFQMIHDQEPLNAIIIS